VRAGLPAIRTAAARGRSARLLTNADQAFFVFAATQPAPSLRMLDRFLVVGEKSEIEQLYIVVNKIDLEDPSRIQSVFAPMKR